MKELFADIMKMKNVRGIIVFSFKGELLYKDFSPPPTVDPEKTEWWPLFIGSLNDVREADFVFEKNRIYIRRTEIGYLFFLVEAFSSIAMLRLNCDILLPSLKKLVEGKGRKSFSKKKR